MQAIPREALERGGIVILGRPDSGKTHAAKTMAETAVDAGWQTIVLEPLSSWRGMQRSADGQSSRLPMLIFGGDGANMRTTHRSGRTVARFLALTELSAVIEMRHLRDVQFYTFAFDFLDEFYGIQLKSCASVWLIIDEADAYAPQVPTTTEEKKLLRLVGDIVARGRTSGIRHILATHRLAGIHKRIVSMAKTMIAMNTIGTHDREAVSRWMDGIAGNGLEIKRTLARLERGEAWVAIPPRPFRMKFPPLTTLDTSATPAAPLPQAASPFAPDELANLVRSFEEIAEYDGVLGRSSEANSIVPALTRLRTCCNLGQTEFAARTGQTLSNLRRYETGEVSPTLATLQELAARVGMQVLIDFQQLHPQSGRVMPFRRAAQDPNGT